METILFNYKNTRINGQYVFRKEKPIQLFDKIVFNYSLNFPNGLGDHVMTTVYIIYKNVRKQ